MSIRWRRFCIILTAVSVLLSHQATADDLLDGRVFIGMIGPSEAPDLPDRLTFAEGHFWSEACTSCGFEPGAYEARETDAGIVFSGVLTSPSRGRFEYQGVVRDNGELRVDIQWERRRWYWTTRRSIAFQGQLADQSAVSLDAVRQRMLGLDPSKNPQCARF